MKEFKGTPGPWRRPKGSMTLFIDAPIGGGILQEVAACCPTENPDHRLHNANLIWAALDLLDGVKVAVDLVDRDIIRVRPQEREDLLAALTKWNTAIAKALGEDNG